MQLNPKSIASRGVWVESSEILWRLLCLAIDNEIHADSYYKTIKLKYYSSISTANYPFTINCDKQRNILLKQIETCVSSFSVCL